jgi:hypothetical protein
VHPRGVTRRRAGRLSQTPAGRRRLGLGPRRPRDGQGAALCANGPGGPAAMLFPERPDGRWQPHTDAGPKIPRAWQPAGPPGDHRTGDRSSCRRWRHRAAAPAASGDSNQAVSRAGGGRGGARRQGRHAASASSASAAAGAGVSLSTPRNPSGGVEPCARVERGSRWTFKAKRARSSPASVRWVPKFQGCSLGPARTRSGRGSGEPPSWTDAGTDVRRRLQPPLSLSLSLSLSLARARGLRTAGAISRPFEYLAPPYSLWLGPVLACFQTPAVPSHPAYVIQPRRGVAMVWFTMAWSGRNKHVRKP